MAATISTADWELATRRIATREAQMEAAGKAHEEQEGRHIQLLAALRTEFLAAQERWTKASAAIEELSAQMEAIRAARQGGPAGALLDPRLLDKPQKFHGNTPSGKTGARASPASWRSWTRTSRPT